MALYSMARMYSPLAPLDLPFLASPHFWVGGVLWPKGKEYVRTILFACAGMLRGKDRDYERDEQREGEGGPLSQRSGSDRPGFRVSSLLDHGRRSPVPGSVTPGAGADGEDAAGRERNILRLVAQTNARRQSNVRRLHRPLCAHARGHPSLCTAPASLTSTAALACVCCWEVDTIMGYRHRGDGLACAMW